MSIIDTFMAKIGYRKITSGAVTEPVPLAIAGQYQWERDSSLLVRNDELYKRIGWINTAIRAVSEYGASVKFSVMQATGEDEKDIPNHPFEVLLRRPNPLMSRAEFLTASFGYYKLAENCYWWINAVNGQPAELWIIPPAQILPICDNRLFISHYQYTPYTGEMIDIPPEQIVHVKGFNPNNPFQGEGMYETVKYQVQQDYGALRNQAAIQTENNGAPPGILAFAGNHDDSAWDRIKRDLADAARKMLKYLPLRGVGAGGVQWLPNALSDREMQVIEKRAFTRDELFMIFAPGYLNMMLPSATEANAKTGKATFSEYAIWPMLNAFAEKITNDLLPMYGDNLVGAFDDVRVRDRVLELQEMAQYALTHTVEEVRRKYWKDDPLGDDRDKLLPAQVTPETGDGTKPPEPEPQPVTMPQNVTQPEQPAQEQAQPDAMENAMESEDTPDEMAAEMKRWRRVARKCIEQGKPVREFKSEIIPPADHARIAAALAECKTVEDVERAFAVKYSDDQPRDEAGRFSDGGSGEASAEERVGTTSFSGTPIYKITDAANLKSYGAIVVAKRGGEILACKDNEYHSDIVESIHPDATVDDYVRFVFEEGILTSNAESAGIPINSKDDNDRAINMVYRALDKLTNAGLPKNTRVRITQGFYGPTINTSAKLYMSGQPEAVAILALAEEIREARKALLEAA